MPIQYECDDVNERVHIISSGDVSLDEVLEAVNWQPRRGAVLRSPVRRSKHDERARW